MKSSTSLKGYYRKDTSMGEPRLEDDVAIGKNQDCDDCEQSDDDCTCSESVYDTLEEMYDDL